ncbi:MAG: dimethyl sulfoxide reductase anchor subunit [Bowdeniella nasicola]|nr:dimethyl sulfoxide reductase anchor subunit [Bowdeniella nasicola]
MNVHELPLIAFTILAQMCVGAFVVLGIIQLLGPRLLPDNELRAEVAERSGEPTTWVGRALARLHLERAPAATRTDRLTDPVLFAIGPVLVLGLLGSMAHLGNPFNALNTFRHLSTSWLSREILFGCLFAGLGFLFAFLQWMKWGSARLRQVVAGLTALVGLGLVYVMSMVYASLPTVPAWNLWTTPATFYVTTFLLGCLAVGAALMTVTMWRRKHLGEEVAIDVATQRALTRVLRAIAVAAAALAVVQVVLLVLQLTTMAADPQMPVASAQALYTNVFLVRLILLILGACLLGFFLYRASLRERSLTLIATVATSAFVVVLVSEVLGRSLFYDTMTRIGM